MRGKYKTQRGRARRFTSSHDPNAYIRSQPARGEDEEEEEEGGSSLNKGKDTTGADGSDSASVSSSSGEGESAEVRGRPIICRIDGLSGAHVLILPRYLGLGGGGGGGRGDPRKGSSQIVIG